MLKPLFLPLTLFLFWLLMEAITSVQGSIDLLVLSIHNNSYLINVYRFRAFWLDLFALIRSNLDELVRVRTTFWCNQCKQYGGRRRETTILFDWKHCKTCYLPLNSILVIARILFLLIFPVHIKYLTDRHFTCVI